MQLDAEYYAPNTPRPLSVTLVMEPDGAVRITGAGIDRAYRFSETRISDRLGNVVRRFEFPDGALAEVADNDAIDEYLRNFGHARGGTRVHALERRWGWALAAVIGLVAAGVAWVVFGVPAVANALAFRLPPEIDDRLGVESLALMDKFFLEPTRLEQADIDRIQARFAELTAVAGAGDYHELVFRDAEGLGANAFALPSGTIIMTDQLVELAANDDEIAAVLAHEIGHVRGRHTLRLILQDSITAAMMAVVVGDVLSITSLAGAVPTVLVQSHYSREFELEADRYALQLMNEAGMDPAHFAAILRRLESTLGDARSSDFLSTHPATEERLRRFE